MTTVSIIIPYYKKINYIFRAIKSINSQTFKNYEVIIIYNDKKLNEFHILKKKLKHKKKFNLIIGNKKQGAAFARNLGIKKSKGKFIAFLDSDDVWHPRKLEKQVLFMNNNKFLFTHTSYYILKNKRKKLMLSKDLDYSQLLKSCDIGLSTVMINKKILPTIPFPNLKTKEDYVLWLKLLKIVPKVYSIKEALTVWRKTDNSLSSKNMQKISDAFRVYYLHCKFNFVKTFFFVLRLSIFSIMKKY